MHFGKFEDYTENESGIDADEVAWEGADAVIEAGRELAYIYDFLTWNKQHGKINQFQIVVDHDAVDEVATEFLNTISTFFCCPNCCATAQVEDEYTAFEMLMTHNLKTITVNNANVEVKHAY